MDSTASTGYVESYHSSFEQVEANTEITGNAEQIEQTVQVSKQALEKIASTKELVEAKKKSGRLPIQAKVMQADVSPSVDKISRSCRSTCVHTCEGTALLAFGIIGMIATLPLTLLCVPPCACAGACIGEFCGELLGDESDSFLGCEGCCGESEGAALGAACGVISGSLGAVFCVGRGYDILKEVFKC